MSNLPLPFEVDFSELKENIRKHVRQVFGALESDFLVMPRGDGFVSLALFTRGYDAILAATEGFRVLDPDDIFEAILKVPIGLVVLRTILGFSPPEWADIATLATEEEVDQNYARHIDRAIRKNPDDEIARTALQKRRIRALIQAACQILSEPAPRVEEHEIHRMDKVDTAQGLDSLSGVATHGLNYASLLYERFLGRPFASHRDSVSELVGGAVEDSIKRELRSAKIPFYQSIGAEPITGWAQNPDFFCPDAARPRAIIEAKMTQDDGTARDKVARILRLAEIRNRRERKGESSFDVIACIAGRGFGVREGDMEELLLATRGKVFTLSQVDRLVYNTSLRSLLRRVDAS